MRREWMERSVLLLFVREIAAFDVRHVTAHPVRHNRIQVGVAAEETRRKFVVDPQHVVNHQHLSVDAVSGPDADQRDFQFRGDLRAERRRDFFEDDSEAADRFEQVRVADQLSGFGFLFGPDAVGAVFMDRLRGIS